MEEKIISALIGSATSSGVYLVAALVQHGRNKQAFETLTKDVEQLKAEQNKLTIKNQIREYSFNRYLEFTNGKH